MKEYYEFWMGNGIFYFVLAGICVLGLAVKLVLACHYQKTVRAVSRKSDKNRLLKSLSQELEGLEVVDNKIVHNVNNFVDKCVYNDKIMGLRLCFWQNAGVELLIICGLAAMGSVAGMVLYKGSAEDTLSVLFAAVTVTAVLFFAEQLLNVSARKKMFHIYLKDYCDIYPQKGVFLELNRALDRNLEGIKPENRLRDGIQKGKEAGQLDGETGKRNWNARREEEVISAALKKQMDDLVPERDGLLEKGAYSEMAHSVRKLQEERVDDRKQESQTAKETVKSSRKERKGVVKPEADMSNLADRNRQPANNRQPEMEDRLSQEKDRPMEAGKEAPDMDATWNLEDVIAAAEEKLLMEKNRKEKKPMKQEELPKLILSKRDEKIIADIIKEYMA